MNRMKEYLKKNGTNVATYALVMVGYIVMQTLSSGGHLSRSVNGYLIPICC